MKKLSTLSKPLFFIVLLIFLAVGERLWFDLGPNVELVALSTCLAGLYLGISWALIIPLFSLAISDRFLGQSSIFVFVWSAYALLGMSSLVWPKKASPHKKIGLALYLGLLFPIFFFLWTNLGVWLQGLWYQKTLNGLIACYIAALPFFKNHLVSSLVLLPAGVGLTETIRYLLKEKGHHKEIATLKTKE